MCRLGHPGGFLFVFGFFRVGFGGRLRFVNIALDILVFVGQRMLDVIAVYLKSGDLFIQDHEDVVLTAVLRAVIVRGFVGFGADRDQLVAVTIFVRNRAPGEVFRVDHGIGVLMVADTVDGQFAALRTDLSLNDIRALRSPFLIGVE